MPFSVQVYFNGFGNHKPSVVVGQVRGLADEFGKPGIMGKRRQGNSRVFRKGYLRVVWPTRKLAKAYQTVVGKCWGHLVHSRRFKIKR